ncbi:hypothetical protein O3M35_011153 [Rhynocoris fuscipes]|uniref:Carboxylic ester hydrolase n=1 Tax=Rhynocoris fuscipes TaxID=488301 RepID=A0AAW1CXF8_9HEMI
MKSRNGRNFIGYSGIPYAKPPIGELRFQDPQPPSKWHKVREPSFIGELCLQSLHNVKMLRNAVIGSEDCLYMSVYTPQLNPLKLYPVLVYIHGGGYEYGAGEFLGRPGYFLDHDIVLVTFNYRLGILGFLSMEDSTLPGNMGLKDQNMVLQWVQKNIRNFGGDPNMVTIYGESAGAGSVHHHMLSPLSKGLFHQAISQSGTALSAKNFLPPGIAKTRAMKLAEKAGCPSSNTEQMLICLREMNAQDITRLNQIFSMKQIESLAPFIPVVDSVAANPFLPKETDQLVPEPVPWMIGCSNMEGLVQTACMYC